MRKALIILSLLAMPLVARAAIAFDAATTISGAASAFNWAHTVTGGNTLLVVFLGIQSNDATSPVTAVTYNDEALTMARRDFVTFQIVEEVWYKVAPASGSNTVSVLLDASQKMVCSATSLTGVHQADPVPTTSGACSSSAAVGPVTIAITTAYDDSWILDGMYLATGSVPVTAASGQTVRWTGNTTGGSDASNSLGSGGTESIPSASANDVIWTWGTSKKRCLQVIEVRAAPVAGGFGWWW